MHVQGIINDERWAMLYPRDKRLVSSGKFDPVLLFLLLRSVCSISSPYPNEWEELPEEKDQSMGAQMVRINFFLSSLNFLPKELPEKDYNLYHKYFSDIMLKFAGSVMNPVLNKVKTEPLVEESKQDFFMDLIKGLWDEANAVRVKENNTTHLNTLGQSGHALLKLAEPIEKSKPQSDSSSSSGKGIYFKKGKNTG
jgi:hypothetical protein